MVIACDACGREVDDGWSTCSECGAELPEVAVSDPPKETSAPPRPIRGRRPGTIARGNCDVCGHEYALRKSGAPFAHRTIASNGYTRLGYCKGGER